MSTYGQDAELESLPAIEDTHEDGAPEDLSSPPVDSAADIQPATMTYSAPAVTPPVCPLVSKTFQTPDLTATFLSHTTQEALPDDLNPHQESCHPEVHHYRTVQRHIPPPVANAMHDTMLELTPAAEDVFYDPSGEALRTPAQMRESFASPDKTMTTPFVASEMPTPLSASNIPITSDDSGVPYSSTRMHRLVSGQEAQLMRFFIDSIAPSFDLCDRDRHFTLVVPQRALMCPILLNAVFAVSAKYLSAVSDFDPMVSDRHSQECLKHLIPKLCDVDAITDENILAATVILRHLEELQSECTDCSTNRGIQLTM